MIGKLLLFLTVLAGSSFASEDWKGTLAFSKFLAYYRYKFATSHYVYTNSTAVPISYKNITEPAYILHSSLLGLEHIVLDSPCQEVKGNKSRIHCYAKLDNLEFLSNVTLKDETGAKNVSYILLTVLDKKKLEFTILKENNSYVRIEEVNVEGNAFTVKDVSALADFTHILYFRSSVQIPEFLAKELVEFISIGSLKLFNEMFTSAQENVTKK